mmetsp:Transcript_21391/g.59293  ORF Transcript_21391/g.59293 Transcript_21391/m.59293 type:complete len:106 (+) Transcript_21391:121-438(+)
MSLSYVEIEQDCDAHQRNIKWQLLHRLFQTKQPKNSHLRNEHAGEHDLNEIGPKLPTTVWILRVDEDKLVTKETCLEGKAKSRDQGRHRTNNGKDEKHHIEQDQL